MEQWRWITIVLLAYLAVTLFIGLRAGRRASSSVAGYVAGDRSFGLLVMYFVTGATVFSAFAFLGAPGWAYSQGAAAFYILAYGVLGIAPFYFLGPRAARLGRAHGYVTQTQLLVGRFPSRALSVLVAALTLIAFVPYIALQIRGAGIVVDAVTEGNVSMRVGSFVAYAVVVAYVLRGGVAAVGWTNTFQGIFMIVVAWVLGIYLPTHLYGGVQPMFEAIADARPELLELPGLTRNGTPWSWGAYSTAILSSAIGLTMWPHIFMKAFAAKSERTLKRTVILFPTFQLFLIPILLIGFAGVLAANGPEDPDAILPFMLLGTGLPPIVIGLFCAGALSASMSTGDALLHAAASVTVEDGVSQFVPMTDEAQRRLMQILVLVIGAAAYLAALDPRQSLVGLLLGSYGIIAQLAPPMIAAMYWRRATTPGVFSGLLAGSVVAVFFFLFPEWKPLDMHEGVLGLIVHVPVLILVSLRGVPQTPEHTRHFFSGAVPSAKSSSDA